MKQYNFLIHFIFGRANFGLIQTNVDVVEGSGEDEGSFLVFKRGVHEFESQIVGSEEEPIPDTLIDVDEVEFMVGDDLDKMIEIYNKRSVDLYEEDMMEKLELMKKNINKRIDIDQ